jgi:hypothetical protein
MAFIKFLFNRQNQVLSQEYPRRYAVIGKIFGIIALGIKYGRTGGLTLDSTQGKMLRGAIFQGFCRSFNRTGGGFPSSWPTINFFTAARISSMLPI